MLDAGSIPAGGTKSEAGSVHRPPAFLFSPLKTRINDAPASEEVCHHPGQYGGTFEGTFSRNGGTFLGPSPLRSAAGGILAIQNHSLCLVGQVRAHNPLLAATRRSHSRQACRTNARDLKIISAGGDVLHQVKAEPRTSSEPTNIGRRATWPGPLAASHDACHAGTVPATPPR